MTGTAKTIKFTVECDTSNNGDLLIQSAPGVKLRSALVSTKGVKTRDGEEVVPVDRVRHLSAYPRIPGMEITVNSQTSSYTISDPLYEDEELQERLTKALREQRMYQGPRVNGVAPTTTKLDQHRFKTLCRELLWIVNAEDAKIKRGTLPPLEDIEKLPGEFLLNPGSRVQNSQPMFEKDFESWLEDLHRVGG